MNLTAYATSKINGSTALWSFMVKHGDDLIHQDEGVLGSKDLILADWFAVGHCLRWLHDNERDAEVILFTTCPKIVSWILGTIDCPKGLIPLRDRCRALALQMPMIDIEFISQEAIAQRQ